MPTFEGSAMFVNLPTGTPGPAYAWIGYWLGSTEPDSGLRPNLVVATAPLSEQADLPRRVHAAHGLPHARAREIDGVAVVIASAAEHTSDAPLQRLGDPEPMIEKWLALATTGLGPERQDSV